MDALLITDIFGAGDHNQSVLQTLGSVAGHLSIVSPYGQAVTFASEGEAYEAFIRLSGHEDYASRVGRAVQALTRPTLVIGFSAGGSAAWRALAGYSGGMVKALLAFYPGQIRHHLQLEITVPSYLLFADEAHFSVQQIMKQLQGRVSQLKLPCQHGFMNPRSGGYDAAWQNKILEGLEEVVRGRQNMEQWFTGLSKICGGQGVP
ncbi:dienelactone hydrolase family protein [Bowmanella dokdonensis]|uniref:Dienelactone hydrolase family protein n=1 Tax=Bowmanella dokdonensis TaxID=751969 RepID=A0A939DMJ5_9ALTE|nr:dienelactone hydrolase family protein [Bowmanella dokdonensis]MBN7824997.1 dienelactone hydrolase family protein [Bowmanella dokdonensis]